MAVRCAVKAAFVEFRSAEPKQYLIVAEIVSLMQGEVLIVIFLV
jgi:hypothetical protein